MKHLLFVAMLVLAGAVSAQPTEFEWSSTTGFLVSRDRALIETVTGQPAFSAGPFWVVEGGMRGQFTYDPDNAAPPTFNGRFATYNGASTGGSTSLLGSNGVIGTLAGGSGVVTVSDNLGGLSGSEDIVNVYHCCGTGFEVGGWQATAASVVWVGDGFQDGFDLPEVLPPVGAPLPIGLVTFFNPATGANSQIITTDIDLREAALAVAIDVKPGSEPNCFNVNGRGVVPVAILGSDSFDVAAIDQQTLSFGGLVVRVRGNRYPQCGADDVNADGHIDLVCQFEDDAGMWQAGNDEATLTGQLLNGTVIHGSDEICLVP